MKLVTLSYDDLTNEQLIQMWNASFDAFLLEQTWTAFQSHYLITCELDKRGI